MPFDVAAILIVLAAAFAYLNNRFIRLPSSVGLTLMGAFSSLIVLAVDRLVPASRATDDIVSLITSIDFHQTLMNGMLSFLLFAGALHVDWEEMRRGRWPILVLSTIGVLLSTTLIGGGFYLLSGWLGLAVPPIWCLVFGALISPTDPVAVMGVLKRTDVSPTLQATVAGESLFNDGVGVVVFSILLSAASGGEAFSVPHALELFAIEAGGGVVLGLLIGWIAVRAMQSIDEYNVEVMMTLAVVMGGYALANQIDVSGPVAMAVAGILIGNHGVAQAMSETTKDYLLKFWSLVDEILNAILFLLIGLEVITVSHDLRVLALGALAIPLALAARTASVLLPLVVLRPVLRLGPQAPATLIWGGLRGGISVALALSLSDTSSRAVILAATYMVVLFAVIAQGATIERLLAPSVKR
ncbi:cation:proton antiporter [Lichenifustis flavocetrariae]|uniref:Sodium:proton antiporter n=1 Tax=Lichenifustis flavocetrariae TaxID=2949735 RepID=A0AA42CLD5_9HYPH|nr:sodium:proton antiporter [Lichenifustis flavocetrariae]MCW6507262.1 sodium:proton antiporter [Lichenifustis flavocetrariae]